MCGKDGAGSACQRGESPIRIERRRFNRGSGAAEEVCRRACTRAAPLTGSPPSPGLGDAATAYGAANKDG